VGAGSPAPVHCDGRAPALLALHGFGGTPREVEALVEVARRRGLAVSAPLLPGHGTHARDLELKSFKDWLDAARTELDRLRMHGKVIVTGLSLGAVLAARLAADVSSSVCGLALFANALHLASPYPARWLAVAKRLQLPRTWWIPKLCADIEDSERRLLHLGYDVEPIGAAVEVYRGGIETRRYLQNITCPTLFVHGALDRVCPVHHVNRVVKALGTQDIRSVILPNSGHVVTEDRERDQAVAAFDEFVARLL
jgi:carboxylesterase